MFDLRPEFRRLLPVHRRVLATGEHESVEIRIENGRVAQITPYAPPPADATVIDWSQFWVLPGLIDVHVHLADFLQSSDPAEPLKHSPEATAYAGYLRFRDDVIVKVSPVVDGSSRVDMRSVSRVGLSDLGYNAARIREFLGELQAQ